MGFLKGVNNAKLKNVTNEGNVPFLKQEQTNLIQAPIISLSVENIIKNYMA